MMVIPGVLLQGRWWQMKHAKEQNACIVHRKRCAGMATLRILNSGIGRSWLARNAVAFMRSSRPQQGGIERKIQEVYHECKFL
jgi:hypothetical protein